MIKKEFILNRSRQNSQHCEELNTFCPPNSSDDLCLFFCIYPSSKNLLRVRPAGGASTQGGRLRRSAQPQLRVTVSSRYRSMPSIILSFVLPYNRNEYLKPLHLKEQPVIMLWKSSKVKFTQHWYSTKQTNCLIYSEAVMQTYTYIRKHFLIYK